MTGRCKVQFYSIMEAQAMTTIYADDLLHVPGRMRPAEPRTRVAATTERPRPTAAEPAPARPRRYEDFELRSTGLGDLLGGRVFPRLP